MYKNDILFSIFTLPCRQFSSILCGSSQNDKNVCHLFLASNCWRIFIHYKKKWIIFVSTFRMKTFSINFGQMDFSWLFSMQRKGKRKTSLNSRKSTLIHNIWGHFWNQLHNKNHSKKNLIYNYYSLEHLKTIDVKFSKIMCHQKSMANSLKKTKLYQIIATVVIEKSPTCYVCINL